MRTVAPAQANHKAIAFTAHKIARTVYFMLKRRVQYRDIGAQAYEAQHRERQLASPCHQLALKESAPSCLLDNAAIISQGPCLARAQDEGKLLFAVSRWQYSDGANLSFRGISNKVGHR